MARNILRIDTSARKEGSVTRQLTTDVIEKLGGGAVVTRDLADGIPLLHEAWLGANFTPAADRSDEQKATLALSDTLVAEVQDADTLVIGVPIYNFGVPAALKAWADLVARAGGDLCLLARRPQKACSKASALCSSWHLAEPRSARRSILP